MKLSLEWKTSVVLALALLLTGCSLMRKGDSNSSSEGNRKQPGSTKTAAFKPSSDARKDLGDALRKLGSTYPYRLTETNSDTKDGQKVIPDTTRVAEFAGPDRSHVKFAGGAGNDSEEITIGEKQYSKTDGKWREETRHSSPQQKTMNASEIEKLVGDAIKDVKYVGPETVNGVPCFAYTYRFEAGTEGYTFAGPGKVWVGAGDGLVHQMDLEYEVANYAHTSHTVYEYNVNIRVEKPAM
jgi:hypothetical protein